jgi:GNAT superfamily N-acetyltransferase
MLKARMVSEPHNESAATYVRDRLSLHNAGVTGHADYYPVKLFLYGEQQEILGGLLGYVWAGWLFVSILWIDEQLRGQGHGTQLMEAAETYARARGCQWAHLDTHSWQARPFYERRGYELFATLDDFPAPHKKFFLKKKL